MIKGEKVRPIRKGQKSLGQKVPIIFQCVEKKKKLSENQLRWDNCMLIAYQLDTVK